MDLDLLINGMAKANYVGGDRTFVDPGGDEPIHYTSWSLDDGALTATFDAKTRKILSLSYTLNCDPARPTGNSFQLRVEWFDCENRQILIQTKKDQETAAVSESNSESQEKTKSEPERRPK